MTTEQNQNHFNQMRTNPGAIAKQEMLKLFADPTIWVNKVSTLMMQDGSLKIVFGENLPDNTFSPRGSYMIPAVVVTELTKMLIDLTAKFEEAKKLAQETPMPPQVQQGA